MTLQGQQWLWDYLSAMMINHCNFVFWLPVQWGSTYGSSVSVNVNLQHKDGQAREPERTNSCKIQTCTYAQPNKTEGGIGTGSIWGGGAEEVRKRGKNCYHFIWSQSSFSPLVLEGILFHYFLSLLPGHSHATWPSLPLPEFYVPAFRKHLKTHVDHVL